MALKKTNNPNSSADCCCTALHGLHPSPLPPWSLTARFKSRCECISRWQLTAARRWLWLPARWGTWLLNRKQHTLTSSHTNIIAALWPLSPFWHYPVSILFFFPLLLVSGFFCYILHLNFLPSSSSNFASWAFSHFHSFYYSPVELIETFNRTQWMKNEEQIQVISTSRPVL